MSIDEETFNEFVLFFKKMKELKKNAGSEAIGTGERERVFGNFLSSTAPIDLVGCFCVGWRFRFSAFRHFFGSFDRRWREQLEEWSLEIKLLTTASIAAGLVLDLHLLLLSGLGASWRLLRIAFLRVDALAA